MEILFENRNFDRKSKFWTKIQILIKNKNFVQKSKFCSKIETLIENRNFEQKSKYWSKIKIPYNCGIIWTFSKTFYSYFLKYVSKKYFSIC